MRLKFYFNITNYRTSFALIFYLVYFYPLFMTIVLFSNYFIVRCENFYSYKIHDFKYYLTSVVNSHITHLVSPHHMLKKFNTTKINLKPGSVNLLDSIARRASS